MLAEQTPTRFIAFDLLAIDDESLLELPQAERRDRLEQLVEKPVDLTPATEDPDEAQPWLQGAEGVIAKRQDAPYRPGERVGMVKIKRVRTIDAVVHGLAPRQGGGHGRLADPRPLRRRRQAARRRPHARLHAPSRSASCRPRSSRTRPASAAPATRAAGTATRELEWIELRPELVVEVTFDHTSNDRIRHGDEDRCAGATTRTRATAGWTSSRAERPAPEAALHIQPLSREPAGPRRCGSCPWAFRRPPLACAHTLDHVASSSTPSCRE